VADEATDLVHDFIAAINRRELAELTRRLHPEATLDAGLRFPRPFHGAEEIANLFESYWRAFPELLLIVRAVHVGRPGAVAILDIVASSPRDEGDAAPNGRYSWSGAYQFTVDGGRVRALTIYGDLSGSRWLPEELRTASLAPARDEEPYRGEEPVPGSAPRAASQGGEVRRASRPGRVLARERP
jgi:hypothetical protein